MPIPAEERGWVCDLYSLCHETRTLQDVSLPKMQTCIVKPVRQVTIHLKNHVQKTRFRHYFFHQKRDHRTFVSGVSYLPSRLRVRWVFRKSLAKSVSSGVRFRSI